MLARLLGFSCACGLTGLSSRRVKTFLSSRLERRPDFSGQSLACVSATRLQSATWPGVLKLSSNDLPGGFNTVQHT